MCVTTRNPRKWSSADDDTLRLNYGLMSVAELSHLLDRTHSSVESRAKRLGLRINRRWSLFDDSFLVSHYGHMNVDEISASLGRTVCSVENRAFGLGIKNIRYFWTSADDEIVKSMRSEHVPYSVIAERLHRPLNSVRARARFLGICGHRSITYHPFNRSYFKCVTDESAYWAGFIAADGCICDGGRSVNIVLSDRDRCHLDHLCACIGYSSPVRVKDVHNITSVDGKIVRTDDIVQSCVLLLHSKEVVSDLFRIYNITSRKSLTLVPPNVNCFRHQLSYAIGLLDGDGTIGSYSYKNGNRFHVIRWMGTRSMIEWIRDVVDLVVPGHSNVCRKYNSNVFTFSLVGKRAIDFVNVVSLLDIPKMKRKWDIAEKCFK